MSDPGSVLQQVARDLDAEGGAWALVGGFAVSARTEPRFTRDVDLAVVVPDDTAAEALASALLRRGYASLATVEHLERHRLATMRLVPPGGSPSGIIVDLLFASSGIESEIVAAATRLEVLPGVHASTATLAHLVALKVLARDDRRRPQDRVDLAALLGQASADDLEVVRGALESITVRGFNREKDLRAELDSLLGELGSPSD